MIEKINQLLPQTQCQKCSYDDCLGYAKALASGKEQAINLCLPGKEEVMQDLAQLLNQPPSPVEEHINQTVYIDEMVCIGCKACIKACPVDAIVGTTKKMHTVIRQECTGCQLCIPVCPVDCIHLTPENETYLPKAPTLSKASTPRVRAAEHARLRFEQRNARLALAREQKLAALQKNNPKQTVQNLLANARHNAKHRKANRINIETPEYTEQKLQQEQRRAAYRKAQKDFQYGTETEKAAAIIFLRQWKEEQNSNQ